MSLSDSSHSSVNAFNPLEDGELAGPRVKLVVVDGL
jgi:hypothetical protein